MAVLTAELADLWTANRSQIDARLATIDDALERLSTGTLDVGSHAAAPAAAHQLAGTAGTYGFAEASEVATALGSGLARPHHGPGLVDLVLSSREWEVLDPLATGHSTDDMAATLCLTCETMRSHIKHLMRKLDVHSRGETVARAQSLRRSGRVTFAVA